MVVTMSETLDRDEKATLLQLAVEDFRRNYPDVPEDEALVLLEQALEGGDAKVLAYSDMVVVTFQHEEFYRIDRAQLRRVAHAHQN
jgi:hypothetical protein